MTGCEKVIDVELTFSEESYVIDAKINKHVNSESGFSKVIITKSRPYFDEDIIFINDRFTQPKSF